MFSLSGDVTVLDNIPGAGKPWLSQVASDESGVWVVSAWAAKPCIPVKWTDGVPEILPLPEKTYRENKGWVQGGMARGCTSTAISFTAPPGKDWTPA